MTDTKVLKGLMVTKGITLDSLASLTGINRASLSNKINNKTEFKTSEVKSIQTALGLNDTDRDAIFFGE